MDGALVTSALLMGLAGAPHCTAMCGAACAGLSRGGAGPAWSFHLARVLSYALGGALAAASVGWAAQLGQASALLRPLWVMLHMAALGLGLFLLWRGRQPAWLENLGARSERVLRVSVAGLGAGQAVISAPPAASARAGLAGLAWLAWPCGLLQSALVVAALASGPLQGAAVMTAFAAASGLGLVLGPMLLARLFGQGGSAWAVRLAGLSLAAASLWALGHGVWAQVAAWCR
jgi:sulfite exporter TauE/SafE